MKKEEKKLSPLQSLAVDLKMYAEVISEVSTDILKEKLSNFPIFIAHQHEVALGEIIIDREELGTQWTIQASTLEEFMEKKIITEEKKHYFKKEFKDPLLYMCLFVVVPEGANFVFYPFKAEEDEQ